MPDLGTQLHDYFVATTPPVETEEILTEPVGVELVRPLRPRQLKRRLPRWAIGLAAGLVVVLLIGGVAWLVRSLGGESAPVITEAPTTTALPTPTTEATLPVDGFNDFLNGLATPNDLQFDPTGALFVSESGEGRVIRVEILPDGSAGESVVVASGMTDAEGLALADDGVLYVSGASVVYRVADGAATPFGGEFIDPEGLAIDANGDLYVADDAESGIRITKVSVLPDGTAGAAIEVVVVPGHTAADIDFGPTGELFVANDLDAVWVIDFATDGSVSSAMLATIPEGPRALAFDQSGTLYVGSERGGTVWSIDPGQPPTLFASGFGMNEGLAVDTSGTLYVSTWETNQVLANR